LNFLKKNLITYSIRRSIKITIEGERDKSRKTICIGTLSDRDLKSILDIFKVDNKHKKYILRRNNDSTCIIIGLDSKSVRFYIDNGLEKNKIGMISVEISNGKTSIKTYMGLDYNGELEEYFHYLLPYLDLNSFLRRSDGQMYLRVVDEIPRSLLNFYCRNEEFFDEVGSPVWFQFSENSFTFYFQS